MADENLQDKSELQTAAERLGEIALLLGGFHPFVAIIGGLVRGLRAEAVRVGIDPGPFDSVIGRVDAVIDRGLSNDEAYRQRHPDGPVLLPPV